jgi:hypothetical protein
MPIDSDKVGWGVDGLADVHGIATHLDCQTDLAISRFAESKEILVQARMLDAQGKNRECVEAVGKVKSFLE